MRTLVIMPVFLFAAAALAQVETGTIVGAARDESAAVVPLATIVFHNIAKGVEFRTQTNEAGRFQSPPLPPGQYEVTAELEHFKRATSTVTLDVNQRVELNFVMVLGAVTESVSVQAASQQVETETSTIGNI